MWQRVSRAAVLDLGALVAEVRTGRILAAVQVWPEEPMPADAELRRLDPLDAQQACCADVAPVPP